MGFKLNSSSVTGSGRDMVLECKDNDHLVECTACQAPYSGSSGLCQFSNNGLGKKGLDIIGNNWRKGEVTSTKVIHTNIII